MFDFIKPTKDHRPPWLKRVGDYELSDGDNIWFDVTLDGETYRIDANHPYSELYEDVPAKIVNLADRAEDEFIDARVISSIYVDPAPLYQEALEKVFDKVEFVSSDWEPGRIY